LGCLENPRLKLVTRLVHGQQCDPRRAVRKKYSASNLIALINPALHGMRALRCGTPVWQILPG
jgi:hypothetical protein